MKKLLVSCILLVCLLSQVAFTKNFTGKTKDEAINKWKIYETYNNQLSWSNYVNGHKEEIMNYVKQKTIKQYNPYMVTPIGIIKKEN